MADVLSVILLERERAKIWDVFMQMAVVWTLMVPRPWESPDTAVRNFRICHRQTSSSPILRPLETLRPLLACGTALLAAVWYYSHHWTLPAGKHNSLRPRSVHLVFLSGPSHRLWDRSAWKLANPTRASLPCPCATSLLTNPHCFTFFPLTKRYNKTALRTWMT